MKIHSLPFKNVFKNRSIFNLEISDRQRSKLQTQLIDLICKILIRYNHLHYYQVDINDLLLLGCRIITLSLLSFSLKRAIMIFASRFC